MTRPVLALLCLVLTALPVAPVAAQGPGDPLERRIRDWLEPLEARRDFSGVIMIRRGSNLPVALTFGYADWVTGAPMTAEARFPAGSITKGLTAAMVRRLIAEGRIDANAPVRRYLPELTGYDGVRVSDVLAHTAGLPRDIPSGALADTSSAAFIDWLARQPAPGAGPHEAAYSNVGYGLLAVLVERVANARFETLLTTEYLIPLDMQDSRLSRDPARRLARVPSGYAAGPLPLDLRAPMADSPSLGAAGLVAPVSDLLRLGEAVANRRLDLFEPDGRLVGGWDVRQVNGEIVYTVQGSVPGYSAGISILPVRDLVIAYGTNIESYPNWALRDGLHALAAGQAVEPAHLRPATDRLTQAHLDAVGEYAGSPFGPVSIIPSEGGLDLVMRERDWRFYLTPTGDDALTWRLFNTAFRYERDAAGRVAAITASEIGLTGEPRHYRLERTDLPPLPEPDPANAAN